MQISQKKTWIFYSVTLLLFAILSYFIFQSAKKFDTSSVHHIAQNFNTNTFDVFMSSVMHNLAEPAAMLLLQIISILLVSRVFGR
jgi:MFS superfamily sulfate permease-like transporter